MKEATYLPQDRLCNKWINEWSSVYICGNKMPTRCERDFYCRSYCLLNAFQAPLCPSAEGYVSGLQDAAASCKFDVILTVHRR